MNEKFYIARKSLSLVIKMLIVQIEYLINTSVGWLCGPYWNNATPKPNAHNEEQIILIHETFILQGLETTLVSIGLEKNI
jgi:hypothetical protein